MKLKVLFIDKIKNLKVEGPFLGRSTKTMMLLLLCAFGLFFGQYQKLDHKLEQLIQGSKALGKSPDGARKLSNLAKNLQVDENWVITSKGAEKKYSCIVFTNNPQELQRNGIIIESTLPKFVTVLASVADLEKMKEMKSVISIVAPDFDKVNNDVSRIQAGANLLEQGVLNNTKYTGEGVLVGIYDTGIDWRHPDFRDPADSTKSRILSIWDQTLTATGNEAKPANFSRGVEYTRAHIEDELDGSPTNFVRENDISGHGTHVAGTVAGNGAAYKDGRHRGFATKADIVIVKGGNGSFPQNNTIDAITYFKQVATAHNKPIVFNMSIGGQSGAHDGSGTHEMAIDEFTKSGPGRVAVISAGNDYGKKIHRKITLPAGGAGIFSLDTGKNVAETEILSFYMYGSTNAPLTAKITTPDGGVYFAAPQKTTSFTFANDNFTGTVYNYVSVANQKRYVQVVLKREEKSVEDSKGLYTIELVNDDNKPVDVHGYKISEAVSTVLQGGDDEYIVSQPGNSANAITVAAYVGRLTSYRVKPPAGYTTSNTVAEGIASFSAKGPRADGVLKPEITASGQSVVSAMSRDARLTESSSANIDGKYYKTNQGTSMSAPGVTGAVALLLQANPNLTAEQVKNRLMENARADAATGVVPNSRWGAGKLDIYQAVADELGCQTSETETLTYDEQFYISSEDMNVSNSNTVFAVRFTPTRTGKLGAINFHTGSGTAQDIPVNVEVRTIDPSGNPGTLLAVQKINSLLNDVQRSAWVTFDFTQFGIPVTSGEDFYVTIDASAGTMSLRREKTKLDKRSFYSTDRGVTWMESAEDYRIRAVIYEDQPQIKKLADQNQALTAAVNKGKNYLTTSCDFVAMVEKDASSTLNGNISAKVWVNSAEKTHVSRRYELTPETNPAEASAKVTLYFSQSEFDNYNATNTVKLPTSPTDEAGKANVLVDKFRGVSSDNSGTSASYSGGHTTLQPGANNVKWNPTYQYWEVSFDTRGFSGFFLRTSSSVLSTNDLASAQIMVYPNPVKENLTIDLNSQNGNVNIFDISGKLVQSATIKKAGTLNMSALAKGVYVVEITAENNTKITKKIIKE